MAATTRWGILAPGKIARTFADDVALVPGHEIVAVGARSRESADAFAQEYDVPHAHASYAALADDPDVDVVYIASPHPFHPEQTRLCLEAGKHVLCEKPVALNARDTEEMVALAAQHDRFFMEAMWTACLPQIRALAEQLRAGRFGTPRQLQAELGFDVGDDQGHRLLDPALGAGALLDMGIYPLTFAHLMLGEAESLTAEAVLSERGIDLDIAIVGRYPGDVLAGLNSSVTSWSSRRASIATDEGRIELEEFHHPSTITFTPYSRGGRGEPVPVTGEEEMIGGGYAHEIIEVGRCLAEGLTESPLVPHAQTLTLMRQMDTLRQQVGVRYPAEG